MIVRGLRCGKCNREQVRVEIDTTYGTEITLTCGNCAHDQHRVLSDSSYRAAARQLAPLLAQRLHVTITPAHFVGYTTTGG